MLHACSWSRRLVQATKQQPTSVSGPFDAETSPVAWSKNTGAAAGSAQTSSPASSQKAHRRMAARGMSSCRARERRLLGLSGGRNSPTAEAVTASTATCAAVAAAAAGDAAASMSRQQQCSCTAMAAARAATAAGAAFSALALTSAGFCMVQGRLVLLQAGIVRRQASKSKADAVHQVSRPAC